MRNECERRLAARDRQIEHLQNAMQTRGRIGQAIGILRERYDLDEGGAFAVLQRISTQCERPLREVADALLVTGTLPTVPAVLDASQVEG